MGKAIFLQPSPAQESPPTIVQQTHKSTNPANALKTMELIDRLMEAVPIYRLSCNMEPEAAKVAYEGMQG